MDQGKATEGSLTRQSTKPLVVSLREQSTSTIQAAIHSPSDRGAVLSRTNAVLALYFDPDLEPETRIGIREEFVRALSSYPVWAVHKAFDAWARSGTRRPSPAEIVALVGKEMQPLTEELRRREKEEAEKKDYRPDPTPEEMEERRAYAQSVLSKLGYSPGARPTGPRRETVTDEDKEEIAAMMAAKRGGAE